jgi:hypothetical protein
MLWLISLILTIAYVIWLTRLINFGVVTATRIAVATESTVDALQIICAALPDDVKQRVAEARHANKEATRVALMDRLESQKKVRDRQAIIGAVIVVGLVLGLFALMAVTANAGEQTRFYDNRGSSLGTAVPQGQGSVRYYDSLGRSLGTSTTTGNTTRFYDAGGRSVGSATSPGSLAFPRR